jgi:hypothetical protein
MTTVGSERGVCFGPNLGSIDYTALFEQPGAWADVRGQLTAFKVYADNVLDHTQCGPNTYGALCGANVFSRLVEWNLPLHLEAGAIKDWDPTGDTLTADALSAIKRVQDAGGAVDIVSMDEPLASTILGATRYPGAPKQLTADHAGDVARYAANFARAVATGGRRAAIIEAYPQHPAAFICSFVRDIVQTNGVPLAFFELDVDVNGISDQKIKVDTVKQNFANFRGMCADLGMAFRVIVTSTRATSADAYHQDVVSLGQRLRALVDQPFDGATVQSWREYPSETMRQLPANLPASDPNSHVGVLRAVLASGLVR